MVDLVFTRFFASPLAFDSLQAAAHRVDRRSGARSSCSAHRRGGPTAAAISEGLERSGPRRWRRSTPAERRRPRLDALLRRRAPTASAYFVKALGDDERSADLLFRLYRYVQRRDLGDERPFSSLAPSGRARGFRRARGARPRHPHTAAAGRRDGRAERIRAGLRRGRRQSIDGLEPSALTDDVLGAVWEQVGVLRTSIASPIAISGWRTSSSPSTARSWMIDFGFSELAASDLLLANDVAELVASSSVVVGPERATAHAAPTVDPGDARRSPASDCSRGR